VNDQDVSSAAVKENIVHILVVYYKIISSAIRTTFSAISNQFCKGIVTKSEALSGHLPAGTNKNHKITVRITDPQVTI
jgi:hypothetical protein